MERWVKSIHFAKSALKVQMTFSRKFKRTSFPWLDTRKTLVAPLMQWRKVDYPVSSSSTSLRQWWLSTAKRVAPFCTSWQLCAALSEEFSPVSACAILFILHQSITVRVFVCFVCFCHFPCSSLAVAGIVDSLIYHSVRVLRAKMQIGKLTWARILSVSQSFIDLHQLY